MLVRGCSTPSGDRESASVTVEHGFSAPRSPACSRGAVYRRALGGARASVTVRLPLSPSNMVSAPRGRLHARAGLFNAAHLAVRGPL